MTTKSKWFVVATEGATTDGRAINRSWIEQMAKNFNPKTYGCRINLEHFRWRYFDKDDAHAYSYGDVIAVKTQETEEGKLQLLAQIDPTPELVALNKARQKIYTSIEVDPNFADTGEAYLVGLAVTDSPASLGTEMLKFSATAQHNPLAERKLKPDNVFSEAVETVLEFEETKESLLDKIKAMFSQNETKAGDQFSEHQQSIELLAEQVQSLAAQAVEKDAEIAKLTADVAALNALVQNVAKQPEQGYTAAPEISGNTDSQDGRFF